MINKDYALKLLKSVDFRRVKYQVVNERIKALKLYEEVKPTLNAISRQDIKENLISYAGDKSIADYIDYHEFSLKLLEQDMKKVSSAIDTISKVDSLSATILYMKYFQHKSNKQIADELSVGINLKKQFDKAIELFCKCY